MYFSLFLALSGCGAAPSAGDPLAGAPSGADAALPVEVARPPLLDPALSVGRVPFGDIDLWLDLGTRTVADVDALLGAAAQGDPGARLAALADQFRGTPFEYESQLPVLPAGMLRVQTRSFDCTTFVVTMVAMAASRSVEELALHLRRMRYVDAGTRVDADPTNGTILDFASDIFVDSAVGQGYLRDVTAEVAGGVALKSFAARPTERRRSAEYDTEERLIRPRLHVGEVVRLGMLAREHLGPEQLSRVSDGDILLFSRVDPGAPVGEELLIGHLAVARVREGVVTLMHATRDYAWRAGATWDTPTVATGLFYADDPRREQLGVSYAGEWVEDSAGRSIRLNGRPFYGYDVSRPRPLVDYMEGAHVRGMMVLRPVERTTEARAADKAALASIHPRSGGDGAAIVDSAMDEQAAIHDGLSPECPPHVRDAQRLVSVAYRAFDGKMHQGQVVVHRRVVPEMVQLFAIFRETGLPLRSVIPISHPNYKWDDLKSMDADNTSAFNWRNVPDSPVLSRHACGLAIDVNPRTNPYVRKGGLLVQPEGAVYDPTAPGALAADHPAVRKLVALGWTWGGTWKSLKDWQHFEIGTCERP